LRKRLVKMHAVPAGGFLERVVNFSVLFSAICLRPLPT
jgi:hypothetical protein